MAVAALLCVAAALSSACAGPIVVPPGAMPVTDHEGIMRANSRAGTLAQWTTLYPNPQVRARRGQCGQQASLMLLRVMSWGLGG